APVLDAGGVVRRAERLVPRRRVRLLALARRADRRRDGSVRRLRLLGGARAAARLLRPDALPHRRHRRRLRSTGPGALLRLLRGTPGGERGALRRGREGRDLRDAADRHHEVPRPDVVLPDADARARRRRARLRLGVRVPRCGPARRRRVLVPGAVGPDRAGAVLGNDARVRRRGAADGGARTGLCLAVPARGHGRAAHDDRPVRAAGGRAARALGLAGRDLAPLLRARRADAGREGAVQVIHTPSVDWFALSTILVLLGASGVALLGAVLVPRRARRAFAASVAAAGAVGGIVTSVWLYVDSPHGRLVVSDAFYRDRWTAMAQVMLCGSALVYGATRHIGYSEIARAVGQQGLSHDLLLVLGLAMIVAGLGFKASAAPFHMWTPDVYEGAPTPVTAFMSSATKVAALL